MATFLPCIATSATWCFCTATASLLGACCGNDKPSTIAPSATSGRKRSVVLLVLSIAIAFAFQYGVAPWLIDLNYSVTNYVVDAWTDGCTGYDDPALQERCAGNNGVYRAAGSATLFFLLFSAVAYCKPSFNREVWPAKYTLFLFMVLATCFIPNDPLFSAIYMNIARVGSVFYILLQQIIFIDVAYNWNDSWVIRADQDEAEEAGSGKKWLMAILIACALLYIASLVGIILLFIYFNGCSTNTAFISVTLVMGILVTAAQLSGEESSLLTSAMVVGYATYLCYMAVTKNPNGTCNPQLGEDNIVGIVLGVGLTIISLAWTGWSSTAEKKINGSTELSEALVTEKNTDDSPAADKVEEDASSRKVAGVVTNQDYGTSSADEEAPPEKQSGGASVTWKLNMVLCIISCFYAMALTGWGSIESGGTPANPDVGNVSMWMIIASQWVVLALYLWTLVAPRLFPDRDFS